MWIARLRLETTKWPRGLAVSLWGSLREIAVPRHVSDLRDK